MNDNSRPQPAHGTLPLFGKTTNRPQNWSQGRAVRLADGLAWSLPKIDALLLVLHPCLINDLTKAFDLAGNLTPGDLDNDDMTIRTAIYHAQLAQLAIALLRINYDLPDEQWRGLARFDQLAEMFKMTHVVADEVAASVLVWMPFYLTRGVERSENLLLN